MSTTEDKVSMTFKAVQSRAELHICRPFSFTCPWVVPVMAGCRRHRRRPGAARWGPWEVVGECPWDPTACSPLPPAARAGNYNINSLLPYSARPGPCPPLPIHAHCVQSCNTCKTQQVWYSFVFLSSNSCALETRISVMFASKGAQLWYLHLRKNTLQWPCEGCYRQNVNWVARESTGVFHYGG